MNVELPGRTTTLRKLEIGQFAAYKDDGTAFGIRCETKEHGQILDLVFMVAPTSNEYCFGFRLLDSNYDGEAFAFSDAILIPDTSSMHVGRPDHPDLGTLIARDDQLLMVARPNRGSRVYVNVINGQIEANLGPAPSLAWFSGWRVSRKLGDRYLGPVLN